MVDKVLHSSKSTEWGTPKDLFQRLNRKYGFTYDPASDGFNNLTLLHSTKEGTFLYAADGLRLHVSDEDGLSRSWHGHRIFLNPPYGKGISAWVRKAAEEAEEALVVVLLPVRTGSRWWREWVEPYADIEFLPGRLKFEGAKWAAPFGSAIARYR